MAMGMSTIIAKPSPYKGLHVPSSAASNRSSLPSKPSFHPLRGADRPHGFHEYNLSFMKRDQRKKLRMSVGSSNQHVPPQAELPSSSPSSGFPGKGWIIGIVLSFFLPFMKNKWGPLTLLRKEVDTTLERVEETVEVVEVVAEGVEKMAEQVEEEHAAQQADATAHLVEDTIHRVEKLEENIESRIEAELANRKQTNEKTSASTTKLEQA